MGDWLIQRMRRDERPNGGELREAFIYLEFNDANLRAQRVRVECTANAAVQAKVWNESSDLIVDEVIEGAATPASRNVSNQPITLDEVDEEGTPLYDIPFTYELTLLDR